MALDQTTISRSRPPDLIPGYKLEKLVGKGGMGEVHRAVQLSLQRTVAVKLLAAELAQDSSFVARFEKEAAALAALSHPNVVSIVDKGKNKDTYFLVMEFIDGQSLREVMRQTPDVPTALRIAVQVCRAIDYAHSRGVIHRDLKPENILFDDQAGGIPKVTDFGLAGFLEQADAPSKFNVTQTHVAMGTLAYMAPEQRVDAKTADGRADIYSLGVILYELLTGEVPTGNYTPVSEKRSGVEKRIDGIVDRCLKANPKDRYAKVSELIAELEPFVPVSFSNGPMKVGKWERLRYRARTLAQNVVRAVSIGLVLAAAAVLTVAGMRARAVPPLPPSPGTALVASLPLNKALHVSARYEDNAERRRFTLGEGPDNLPLQSFGGASALSDKALRLGVDGEPPYRTRVRPDLSDTDGPSIDVSAEVVVKPATPGLFERLGHAFKGTSLAPHAALLLEGKAGRYVAVILSGRPDAPVQLEWALGERRGTMTDPTTPPSGATRLELYIDRQGDLRAYIHAGRDRRQVGEPLSLGANWQNAFGKTPTVAYGCLEALCEFHGARLDIDKDPPPPVQPAVVAAPTPPRATPTIAKAPAKAPARAPAKTTPVKKTTTRRK